MPIDALTAYAHVVDVRRSMEFYRLLGLEAESRYESEGKLVWALVARATDTPGDARVRLMLALASGPIDAATQAVLFYCWAPDVHRLHDELAAAGVEVGEITRPFYMRQASSVLRAPDGYVLLVGQLDDSS